MTCPSDVGGIAVWTVTTIFTWLADCTTHTTTMPGRGVNGGVQKPKMVATSSKGYVSVGVKVKHTKTCSNCTTKKR